MLTNKVRYSAKNYSSFPFSEVLLPLLGIRIPKQQSDRNQISPKRFKSLGCASSYSASFLWKILVDVRVYQHYAQGIALDKRLDMVSLSGRLIIGQVLVCLFLFPDIVDKALRCSSCNGYLPWIYWRGVLTAPCAAPC